MEERSGSGSPIGGILGLVGGLFVALGSVLVWFTVKSDTSSLGGQVLSQSVKGTEASDGKVTLIAGIIVLVAAVAIWAMRAKGANKGLSVLVGLGGLVAGGLGLYDILSAESQVIDAAAKEVGGGAGVSLDQVKEFLQQAFDQGILKISPGIGIMLVVAGGALALVAGVLGLAARKPALAVAGAMPPPMPMGGMDVTPSPITEMPLAPGAEAVQVRPPGHARPCAERHGLGPQRPHVEPDPQHARLRARHSSIISRKAWGRSSMRRRTAAMARSDVMRAARRRRA